MNLKIKLFCFALCILLTSISCKDDSKHKITEGKDNSINESLSNSNQDNTLIKNDRKLRYLFWANGGVVGYFDDGTRVGCSRCEFNKNTVLSLYDMKSRVTYEVLSNGDLLIDNTSIETPNYKEDKGWALINYVWNEWPSE